MKTLEIQLAGDIPSLKNSKQVICRGTRPMLIPSARYKNWHEEMLWVLKKYKPHKPIECCEITIVINAKTKRLFDLDNKVSSLMDTLVDAEIIKNDTYDVVQRIVVTFGEVDKIGGALIKIEYEN